VFAKCVGDGESDILILNMLMKL